MGSFDKYSNYNENTSFSSVVFGAEKPVLEVELNEMQQILDAKLQKIGRALGVGYYPLEDSNISINMNKVTVNGGIVVAPNGLVVEVKDSLTVTVNGSTPVAYFEVNEIDVTSETVLKKHGLVSGEIIDNPIVDLRIGVETSRRKAVTYALKVGSESKLENSNCVGVCKLSNGYINRYMVGVEALRSEVAFKNNAEFVGSVSMGRMGTVGAGSTALGYCVTASGQYSTALGKYTVAKDMQFALGSYNDDSLSTENSANKGTALVIGNGTSSSAKSNAFRVQGDGSTFAKGAYNSTGADYAEYLEWADGNPNNEDRRGYFVTFDEEKPNMIRKANANDIYILGVVSGNPCIIGNSDECWLGKNLFDEFNSPIYEEVDQEIEFENEDGEIETETITVQQHKVNPNYDPTQPYKHRSERQEWSAVGWIGVLPTRDDGTCEVGGYCTWGDDGIAVSASPSRFNYRVIERVNENIVKIVLK